MNYRYQLAPYAGKESRLICPNCGQRQLVPYIDTETGGILDAACGKCNRLSKCGYHCPPRQFFREHPEARPQGASWKQAPNWFRKNQPYKGPTIQRPRPASLICELPRDIVEKSIRVDIRSNLVEFLSTILPTNVIEGVVFLYNLGVTKAKETIFWQQDFDGRFRGGKVIQYNPETGHRVKENNYPVRWIHQSFIRKGYIPEDWKMTQCLFGEHLLRKNPAQVVCLVEAEKTAVICAGLMPEYNWLATGGKTQLNNERLDVLRGRKIIAFPDIDAYDEWVLYFRRRCDLDVTVSSLLEDNATDEDRKAQIDIADILVRTHCQ